MTQPSRDHSARDFAHAAPLPIIPVLDLKGGKVVRGEGGDRDNYQPWHSPLCPSADPWEFVAAVEQAVGHNQVYLADIDALQRAKPDWEAIAGLAKRCRLVCDVGVRTKRSAEQLASLLGAGGQGGTVVLASETIHGWTLVEEVLACVSPDKLAFSFDFFGGDLLSAGSWLNRMNWLVAASQLADRGVRRFLLVDLHAVGSARGGSRCQECQQLRRRVANAVIVAGGGVANSEDASLLMESGCDAVLAATALHGIAPKPGRWT